MGTLSVKLLHEVQSWTNLRRLGQKKMRELMSQMSTPSIDKPIIVSDRNFEQTIKNYPLVVVDCWAVWCAPCRAIAPVVEQLAKEYTGKVVFGKLNVDENPETQRKFGIMAIPTLLVMKNGKEADRIVGALPKSELQERISAYA